LISDTNVSAGKGSTTKEEEEEEDVAMLTAASLGAEQLTEGLAEKPITTPEKKRKLKAKRPRRAVLFRVRNNIGAISKDLSSFRKNDQASSRRVEKQISQMRSELTSLKSAILKERVGAMKKREAYMSKLLAKLEFKPKKKERGKK